MFGWITKKIFDKQHLPLLTYIFHNCVGLYDTVFDVDDDKDRAHAEYLKPNGFSFDGANAPGVDYALNR